MKSIKYRNIIYTMFLVLVVGCDKPKDVPQLYPCTVKVVNTEGPISDVNVLLYPKKEMKQLTIKGKTDSNGVAVLKTIRSSWVGDGVPLGQFNVTLNKEVIVPSEKTEEELLVMPSSEAQKYNKEMKAKIEEIARIIPKKLRVPGTTSLSVNVTKSGGELLVVNVSEVK